MTKTLTEQWREGTLPRCEYYIKLDDGSLTTDRYYGKCFGFSAEIPVEVLAPVPSYDELKEMSQKIERLELDNEAFEMACNEGNEINAELIEKTEQLVQKIHILNEQNTKQYNELCKTIKQLKIAKDALEYYADGTLGSSVAQQALKEMEGVK